MNVNILPTGSLPVITAPTVLVIKATLISINKNIQPKKNLAARTKTAIFQQTTNKTSMITQGSITQMHGLNANIQIASLRLLT